jgi:hypothetical protein
MTICEWYFTKDVERRLILRFIYIGGHVKPHEGNRDMSRDGSLLERRDSVLSYKICMRDFSLIYLSRMRWADCGRIVIQFLDSKTHSSQEILSTISIATMPSLWSHYAEYGHEVTKTWSGIKMCISVSSQLYFNLEIKISDIKFKL